MFLDIKRTIRSCDVQIILKSSRFYLVLSSEIIKLDILIIKSLTNVQFI